jgi:hypothetical protein
MLPRLVADDQIRMVQLDANSTVSLGAGRLASLRQPQQLAQDLAVDYGSDQEANLHLRDLLVRGLILDQRLMSIC